MSESVPHCARRMRLRTNVFVATGADGQVALLHGNRWGEHLGVLTAREQTALRELAAAEHTEPELLAMLGESGGNLLRRLHAGGWLTVQYGHRARPLVTVRPLGPHRVPRPAPVVAPRLSRFALLRRNGDELVLESPLARAQVVVHDLEVVAVLHHLAKGSVRLPAVGLPPSIVAELIDELAWYDFVHEAEEDSRPDLAAEQWSPHELWFHSRSRAGYHDLPMGATNWAAERHPALPVRRPAWAGTAVALPVPDEPLAPTLSTVLEARRSVREPGSEPLTLDQLGEFLHRVARVRHTAVDGAHEVSLRPAPSGGALHSLEIYPVVVDVTELPAGMYHYDPFDHLLAPVPASEFACQQLVNRAAAAAGGAPRPQVLFVIAARFGRVMWKYQSMSYALILKDLGALIQTMYLVATAMNLAPCALGTGDVELFAQATGLPQLEESSVGEFILSSRAA